jgi:uncharacterized membrane protein YraQ (UPF0718 family)
MANQPNIQEQHMDWKIEWKPLVIIIAVFLACLYLPVGTERFDNAILEAFHLTKWYAQEHVLLCLIPAFFIAGAIGVFVSQGAVMRYLGPAANKLLAYGVASVSGTILAVCSCTILPLFSGIHRMGAGLGPEMGIARALGAIIFSIVIGGLMAFIFRAEERDKVALQMALPEEEQKRSLLQNGLYFGAMVAILVFANWGKPAETVGAWAAVYNAKWLLTAGFAAALGVMLVLWFNMRAWKVGLVASVVAGFALLFPAQPVVAFTAGFVGLSVCISTDRDELGDWFSSSWGFAKQILPLLLFGVLIAGALLGRVGHEGLIPSEWVARAVGGNSLQANFFASFAGAFMYFATLTEVPILQGLIGSGMGKGPALALLLAGPALSLPNMLVINSVLGVKKTATFVGLVIVMATFSGLLYGSIF